MRLPKSLPSNHPKQGADGETRPHFFVTMKILNGLLVADHILKTAKLQAHDCKVEPCLAVILAGSDPASQVYVKRKHLACEKAGVRSINVNLSHPSTEEILSIVRDWNEDPTIHGILVQLPLPEGVDKNKILNAVNPLKDVDGFHPENLGLLAINQPRYLPCTVAGVLEILKYYSIPTIGRDVVIINRSNVIGVPLAIVMARPPWNSTVSICHEHTVDLEKKCRKADIIVTAVGRPEFKIAWAHLKPGAVVIDVAIRRVGKKIIGDFQPEGCRACSYTPVPGGVGPCTVACLIQNVISSARGSSNAGGKFERR